MKTMFTLTAFDTLLFEGRSVLSTTLRGTGSERAKENKSVYIGRSRKRHGVTQQILLTLAKSHLAGFVIELLIDFINL